MNWLLLSDLVSQSLSEDRGHRLAHNSIKNHLNWTKVCVAKLLLSSLKEYNFYESGHRIKIKCYYFQPLCSFLLWCKSGRHCQWYRQCNDFHISLMLQYLRDQYGHEGWKINVYSLLCALSLFCYMLSQLLKRWAMCRKHVLYVLCHVI